MKKHILFLDDDVSLRDSISSYLRSEGFSVETVSTVKMALQTININKPDIIIADIMMPELNGYDLIQILRMNDIFASIPLIFLTAKGMTSDRIKGYKLGCNAYLIKPFNPDELIAIINSLLCNIKLLRNDYISYNNNINPSSIDISSDNFNSQDKFTLKEMEVLSLLSLGLMNKEIAGKLNFSLRNVEKYVSRLLKKTKTRNRTELAQFAWKYKDILRANDGNRTRE